MILKRFKAIVIAGAVVLPVMGQSAFKGQLHISREAFILQGSLLRVQMRVSYNRNLLNRGETLNFTPVLKDSYQHQALSSVVITGKGDEGRRLRGNIPVVTSNSKEGKYVFDYDTTIPFAEWMRSASLYIESEERTAQGKGHVYEDCVFSNLRFGRAATSNIDAKLAAMPVTGSYASTPSRAEASWVQIIVPGQVPDEGITVSGMIPLADERHIGAMGTRKFNEAILEELQKSLARELQVPGTRIERLSLTGYGAPIGNYRQNEVRSNARALELKDYMLTAKGDIPSSISIGWVAEDWDSIQQLISASQMRLREAALDIIRSVDVASGREAQLRMLDGGTLYSILQQTIFPAVCRLQFTAVLSRKGTTTPVVSSRAVSLMDMFRTAQAFKKGSQEFNDLIDLSARLYPDYTEANVNAAGVALMRGDLRKAAEYLKGLDTDTRAYNNYGVLYMLLGEKAKAEVYLRMAEAQGVHEAIIINRKGLWKLTWF